MTVAGHVKHGKLNGKNAGIFCQQQQHPLADSFVLAAEKRSRFASIVNGRESHAIIASA
jgi:hypothetical protein